MESCRRLAFVLVLGVVAALRAQEQPPPAAPSHEPAAQEQPSAAKLLAKYTPVAGTAKLGTVAEVKLGDGWQFLAGANGRRFLSDIGNRNPDASILGVAVPPDFEQSQMFAVYNYDDEGHVSDDEAPDYDQLLTDMKANAVEQSEELKKAGLGGVALLGWAEPPHYDRAQHKLYWAETLKFEDNDGLTLNYNVRVLGRRGHLVVKGVGGIEQLPLVAANCKQLLTVTDFVAGERYTDFDPNMDKVAAYGIGGLIAGAIAAKAGLFAKLLVLLKVAIKPIIAGVIVLGGVLAKVFGGRKKQQQTKPADAS
jgi:uncharacterized membrane-anchored protein